MAAPEINGRISAVAGLTDRVWQSPRPAGIQTAAKKISTKDSHPLQYRKIAGPFVLIPVGSEL